MFRSASAYLLILSVALLLPLRVSAQETPDTPAAIEFTAEVNRGEEFARQIAPNLVFRLAPADGGWRITMHAPERCDPAAAGQDGHDDFVYVATPPFRFQNAQHLSTEYATPAATAVSWVRTFGFVTSCAAFAAEMDKVQTLLWPAEAAPDAVEAAQATLGQDVDGHGMLEVLESRISGESDLGTIQWIRFRVALELPR